MGTSSFLSADSDELPHKSLSMIINFWFTSFAFLFCLSLSRFVFVWFIFSLWFSSGFFVPMLSGLSCFAGSACFFLYGFINALWWEHPVFWALTVMKSHRNHYQWFQISDLLLSLFFLPLSLSLSLSLSCGLSSLMLFFSAVFLFSCVCLIYFLSGSLVASLSLGFLVFLVLQVLLVFFPLWFHRCAMMGTFSFLSAGSDENPQKSLSMITNFGYIAITFAFFSGSLHSSLSLYFLVFLGLRVRLLFIIVPWMRYDEIIQFSERWRWWNPTELIINDYKFLIYCYHFSFFASLSLSLSLSLFFFSLTILFGLSCFAVSALVLIMVS